ncbi:hypothetical protein VTL71DRAFT_7274 [Oculimacula yallundae]|uniref:2EXR domain-containing protein n=1 Tax=Oculimacula yallundae TaxID=86028 RepID=A0ABR4BXD2_9HELO
MREIMRQERKISRKQLPAKFHLFPKLPTEIRIIIWRFTLEARAVEIQWTETRGFFTRVPTPMALRVCRDSREAVNSLYPRCFGNVLYEPKIVFNFTLDTLYIDQNLQNQALHFLASLSTEEVAKIRYLAVDNYINEDWEYGGSIEWDLLKVFNKLASNMPALQEYRLVRNLVFCSDDEVQEGIGPMHLYEEWPLEIWRQHCCDHDHFIDYESDDECDCDTPPDTTKETAGLKIPKMGAIWGWRPTKD